VENLFFDGALVQAAGQVRKRMRVRRRIGEGTSVAPQPETRAAQPIDEHRVSVPVAEPGAAVVAGPGFEEVDHALAMTIGRQVSSNTKSRNHHSAGSCHH